MESAAAAAASAAVPSASSAAGVEQVMLERLKTYLGNVCVSLFDVPSAGGSIMSQENEQYFNNFIRNDSQLFADLIHHDDHRKPSLLHCIPHLTPDFIQFSSELTLNLKSRMTLAFTKLKDGPLDESSSLPSQIIVMTIRAGVENSNRDKAAFLVPLQRQTKHSFTPLIRRALQVTQSSSSDPHEIDNLLSLQKKIRELDLAIDQCQRSTLVPLVHLTTLESLQEIASSISATDLKRFLEKYVPAQVDAYFEEIGLLALMGADGQAVREEFANEVNKYAKQWPNEISKQTKLLSSSFPSSISKEVEFWKDFDLKISDTKRQLDEPAILLTKLILKRTNRVSEELIREAENELERAISIVQGSCGFLRDFPIDNVIGAPSLTPSLTSAVTACLHHFKNIKYAKTSGGGGYGSMYDLHRAARLLDSLSSEVHQRLLSLLKERNVMKVSFEEFQLIVEECQTFFKVWENEFVIARNFFNDMEKRKSIKLHYNTTPDHQPLRQRLSEIAEFRAQHEKLYNILSEILSDKEDSMIIDLRDSYRHFLSTTSLDVLDTSEEGQKLWSETLGAYEKRLERMEDSISRLICDQLKNAKSTDETFRLFSIFNPLFFRRSIWNAVGTYRSALIRDVHTDIERLQEKFKQRYDESLEKATADLRDIPPLSGRILWARQIENQLKVLLQRLQHVLGTSWQEQSEGKKLKEVCQELLNFLNVDTMFESWTSSVSSFLHDMGQNDTVILLVNAHPVTGKKYLSVNYDQRLVQLFKEVRHLEWLLPHTTIPYMIKKPADEAFARYPHASTLQSALASYYQAKKTLTPNISILVGTYDQAIKELVNDAIMGSKVVGSKQYKKRVNWGGEGLDEWVENFSRRVNRYEEKVEDAIVKGRIIDDLLSKLRSCPFERLSLAGILSSIQSTVDEMQMRGFSFIDNWVAEIDQTIEKILSQRLEMGIERWVKAFADEKPDTVILHENSQGELPVVLDQTVHEILLSNQVLYLSPPLEQARAEWMTSFHQFLAMVSTLPRIMSSQFNVFPGSVNKSSNLDYGSILQSMTPDILRKPYIVIENKLHGAKAFVQQWLQYQVLWDVPVTAVTEKIGREIDSWQKLLIGVKAARATIESQKDEASFGPIVINFRKVQNIINLKYDTWQKELQQTFGGIVSDGLRELHTDFLHSKRMLESIQLEGPTKDVISGVEYILKLKDVIPKKKIEVLNLEQSEKLLHNQRYQFPRDWLSASNTTSLFGDLMQILDRRVLAMDSQLASLQAKIKEESTLLRSRVNELFVDWEKQRPTSGESFTPVDALQILSMFATQSTKVQEDQKRIIGATTALGLDILDDDRVDGILSEIGELKDVWSSITPTWDRLQEIRAGDLKGVSIPKLRKQLDGLLEELNSLPLKVRSYSPFENLQSKISKYLNAQPVLRDIVSEALKDRHWKVLMSMLQLHSVVLSHVELKLGHIWDANIMANKKAISELLQVAQGELALEQYIKDVKEYWTTVQFKIVLREGNIRLITEWTELFTMLEDHLNSLASLKQSPYFRNVPEFQEDATVWENKLTGLRGIFDVWIEVQRKWVYLQGIFNNSDIKTQLPSQYTKFKGVDSEFSKLMKRAHTKPQIHEILNVEGILAQLERQDSTMTLIQKALGEYLEKQRQIFPRFYFVNNDDLVEIIGNNNEPSKVFTHLSKMFAALSSVSLSDDNRMIADIGSKEGELVTLKTNVDLTVGVKEWLCKLEIEMVSTLASILQHAMETMSKDVQGLISWIEQYPAQMVILASQVKWCEEVESALSNSSGTSTVSTVLGILDSRLKLLSESVLHDIDISLRRKCEQLITEIVHQRDVTRQLVVGEIKDRADFSWIYHLRFYWNIKEDNILRKLTIKMSNASFFYGFEYLGISERLVQTNLTDRCYLTLTQALHLRMGGNPFGPAGTGKTESVKMLGSQLGRFVLVFNCDENFDYAAMGRIFAGLCQVGAWGCFDEFNRLEERILSAVSQQILTIQRGLMARQDKIELLGVPCKLHSDVGIFVTMNPGYAGRSNLPDNLKQLFRAVAMVVPDRKMIAQVMLFSQGIISAEELAGKIVLLFTLCEEQLSPQSHYDFGLRSLKSVLTGAGDLKRQALLSSSALKDSQMEDVERDVLIRATCNSIVPKLVADDIPLFSSLLRAVFPGMDVRSIPDDVLIDTLRGICEEDSFEFNEQWIEKILQLKHVIDLRHGVMLVGPSYTGKTTAWRTLLKALGKIDGTKGDFYVIDPKSIKKDKLYGTLDPNTLEWTDGIFTKLLRKICEASNVRSGQLRRSWIVFDGDVDPEWAENLNSVLDDNKILTLPSGDRLKLTPNVRIIMEVDTLKHATLATVSRCGMVWFPENIVTRDMMFQRLLNTLRKENLSTPFSSGIFGAETNISALQKDVLTKYLDVLAPYFTVGGLVDVALNFSLNQAHVMEARGGRLLTSLHALLLKGLVSLIEYYENVGNVLSDLHLESYSTKYLLSSLLWAFGSSFSWDRRASLADVLLKHSNIHLPSSTANILDYTVDVNTGEWVEWATLVPLREIESHRVLATDVVVTTTDTLRHIEVLKGWLASHKPLILCGPPGSGKTMTLTNVVDTMPELVLAPLNFSSGTTPELILKTFTQYCEVVDSPDGLIMLPNRQSYSEDKWLVVFCDEINLPQQDRYGTQRVIMFLRQLTEQGGFWNKDCKWVTLRRIQFIGACNPPTDAGRVPLSERFLRHAPLLLVDYPAQDSLRQIYRCFNQALLKLHPNLRGYVDSLTDSMVEFYSKNQGRFTPDVAPQYIYSPRELSRWVRALYEAMEPQEAMTIEELVRLWGHEALRLFHDRLVSDDEREWCNKQLDATAYAYFPQCDLDIALRRPLLYSNWLSKNYQSVSKAELNDFLSARLKVFYEEELDVPLVIFDDVIEHVLRIDNVLRHPMGHLLLVGDAGVGKTVLSRFVSWMNGLSIFQIKANNRYTIENFDEDLRGLLRRVGVEGEKVCFIFDESNAMSSAFLERMNALLASGEVPGLFEGEDLTHLLTACQNSIIQREGSLLSDTEDEIWRKFTKAVQRNLHVVFTMNPASTDFNNRCTTSPALFNRCVVNWFGTWSQNALAQVGYEFTSLLDTGYTTYIDPTDIAPTLQVVLDSVSATHVGLHEAVVASLVGIHNSVKNQTQKSGKASGRHYLSPRDYLDLIRKFVAVERERRTSLEDQQTHIRTGLNKLHETQSQVTSLRHEMVEKETVLHQKDEEANKKLNQMLEKQNEAEQRKLVAEELTRELNKQNEEIRVRKETVQNELSEAEPALESAKQSVQNIRKSQLDEVRALGRPPAAVQLTMEMVSVMLGEKSTDWTEIRKVIRRDDFISLVVNFDPLSLNSKQVKKVQEYLGNPELDHASVDRASKACGPLYVWAQSQIHYSTILRKVKPLRDEVESLEEKSKELTQQHLEAIQQVSDLETAINQYKAEYASAIRDTETIRSEMVLVKKKVARAESLLSSLDEEKERWQITSNSFDEQMSTLIGDSLLAASFLTYAGIFDHLARQKLYSEWTDILDSSNVPFRPDLDMIPYLSNPSDQLLWKSYGLSSDPLAIQNCIILERFYRFPLVIDPSGQAVDFLLRKYAEQKIVKTSFLDASFLKTLASAVRFGTPLLVQDVELVDPILNPLLNKEFQKTGGRTLIRIGAEDIDYSPKFMIILTTRNPLARFPPDLCSRVTMVNFTVTPGSLESQAMSKILQAERPDVDRRRIELQRLQSEQSAKLRELEELLLNKISAVQGAILDDDTLVNTLETIKAEAGDLNREALSTEQVMEEIRAVSATYEPLATAMAMIYFTLEKLSDINFLYQFGLQFFLRVLDKMLSAHGGQGTSVDSKQRVLFLMKTFFVEISKRVLRSLKFEDKVLFVSRLSQIFSIGHKDKELDEVELDYLLRGVAPVVKVPSLIERCKVAIKDHSFPESTAQKLLSLVQLSSFGRLLDSMDSTEEGREKWKHAYDSESPESMIPTDWIQNSTTQERSKLLILMVISIIRPDRVTSALENYVTATLGSDFKWRDLSLVDLRQIIESDSISSVPIMLCSEMGQDASTKVDQLATNKGKLLLQVAMGSAEGYSDADKSIAQASKMGSWVLLRNVHLCPEWLTILEKRLHNLTPHAEFRLFLTCEVHPQIPTSLIRACDVIFVEASTGIKANLQRFLANMDRLQMDRPPVERFRLFALQAWLNAVVQERLRYAPLGWTKRYEFSEADSACAVRCIDQWVDAVVGKRTHVPPSELPWKAIRTSLSQSLYGGRIDNPFDQVALDSFIGAIFRPENYGASPAVAVDYSSGVENSLVTLPDILGREEFEAWVHALPDKNSPTWLGLPATAENQLQSLMGQRIIYGLTSLMGVEDVDILTNANKSQAKSTLDTVTTWIAQLKEAHNLVPIIDPSFSSDVSCSPLQRCLAREIFKGKNILGYVLHDLSLVRSYYNGEIKSTNMIRDLISCFLKGVVPQNWRSYYPTSSHPTVGSWISNLTTRCSFLQNYSTVVVKGDSMFQAQYWIGGLFSPEAFITATRQTTAQANHWSLEELELFLEIGEDKVMGSEGSVVEGLVLECAEWSKERGLDTRNTSLSCRLPPSRLVWRRRSDRPQGNYLTFPIYLNETRTSLVVEILLEAPVAVPAYVWSQRGIVEVFERAGGIDSQSFPRINNFSDVTPPLHREPRCCGDDMVVTMRSGATDHTVAVRRVAGGLLILLAALALCTGTVTSHELITNGTQNSSSTSPDHRISVVSSTTAGRRLSFYSPYLDVPGFMTINLCPGYTLEASMCPTASSSDLLVSCSGDPMLELHSSSETLLAMNDNYCGSCPSLLYTANGSSCEDYSLEVSCASGNCNGTVGLRVTTNNCPLSSVSTALFNQEMGTYYPILDCSLVQQYRDNICSLQGDWSIISGGNYRDSCALDGQGYGCNKFSSWRSGNYFVCANGPTNSPTSSPTAPSTSPTLCPTRVPTRSPTSAPSYPTSSPTMFPSYSPTLFPTVAPYQSSTFVPTAHPSPKPPTFSRQPSSPLAFAFQGSFSAGQSDCATFSITGALNKLIVSLQFPSYAEARSYVSDFALGLAEMGSSLHQIGGYNIFFDGETEFTRIRWPSSWDTPEAGYYSTEIDISQYDWSGTSNYTLCIMNGWDLSESVYYQGIISFSHGSSAPPPPTDDDDEYSTSYSSDFSALEFSFGFSAPTDDVFPPSIKYSFAVIFGDQGNLPPNGGLFLNFLFDSTDELMRPVSGVGNVSEPVDNLEVPPASGYIAVVWRQMLLDDLTYGAWEGYAIVESARFEFWLVSMEKEEVVGFIIREPTTDFFRVYFFGEARSRRLLSQVAFPISPLPPSHSRALSGTSRLAIVGTSSLSDLHHYVPGISDHLLYLLDPNLV